MKWIIGGTKDSRIFVEKLIENLKNLEEENSKNNILNDFVITVVSDYGEKLLEEYKNYGLKIIKKSMNEEEIEKFIEDKNIKRIFDFSHPYAVEISKNAMEASIKKGVDYYRYERKEIKYEKALEFYDIKSLVSYVENISENILVTLGTNEAKSFKGLKNLNKIYFRVLPVKESIEKLENIGVFAKNIIGLQGPFSKEFNKTICKNYDIKYLITKESGDTGGELEKLETAKEENIILVILKRPKVKYLWVSENMEEIVKICKG